MFVACLNASAADLQPISRTTLIIQNDICYIGKFDMTQRRAFVCS